VHFDKINSCSAENGCTKKEYYGEDNPGGFLRSVGIAKDLGLEEKEIKLPAMYAASINGQEAKCIEEGDVTVKYG
jgi:hypothetical protein